MNIREFFKNGTIELTMPEKEELYNIVSKECYIMVDNRWYILYGNSPNYQSQEMYIIVDGEKQIVHDYRMKKEDIAVVKE